MIINGGKTGGKTLELYSCQRVNHNKIHKSYFTKLYKKLEKTVF